jgi:hypothetical protein
MHCINASRPLKDDADAGLIWGALNMKTAERSREEQTAAQKNPTPRERRV